MVRPRDTFWEYMVEISDKRMKCKFCGEVISSTITRAKYHLAKMPNRDVKPCPNVLGVVFASAETVMGEAEMKKQKLTEGSSSTTTCNPTGVVDHANIFGMESGGTNKTTGQPKIMTLVKKKEKELPDIKMVTAMIDNNLSFNLLRSTSFKEAITCVANFGPGYVLPGYETARTSLLKNIKDCTKEYIEEIKEWWKISGCTVMFDCWTDGRKRPHINLLVTCPKMTIFLKSECTVNHRKDGRYITDFITSGIEEIGAENVIQFISDNASNYTAAGIIIEERFPNIFKTQCAAHCLDLILEDIDQLSYFKPILKSARTITKFMYRFQHVLDLMRKHTGGKELKRPGTTRFATEFLCLQSVLKEENALRLLVASAEWRALPQSKTDEGVMITSTIQWTQFWEHGNEIIQIVEPLVRVLRMVDGDGSTMGYLYEGMDRAKEAIKTFFKDAIEKYLPIWTIIDNRCNNNLHSPLHAFASFLNPQLYYAGLVKMDKKVKIGLEIVMDKMISNENDKSTLAKELFLYQRKSNIIFTRIAITNLQISHPRCWWEMWGCDVPLLQKLAIKLQSQSSSASACERNWSAFDAAHTKKRNRLEPKKLHDLVFFRMNLHFMKTAAVKEDKDSTPIDLQKILAFPELDSERQSGLAIKDRASSGEEEEEEVDSEDDDTYFERLSNPIPTTLGNFLDYSTVNVEE